MAKKDSKKSKGDSKKSKKDSKKSKIQDSPRTVTASSVIDGDPAHLTEIVQEVRAQIANVRTALGTLVRLTGDQRQHSLGRYRDGEDEAIGSVFDAMEASPTTFQALADKDNGDDDAAVETAPSRRDLARREALLPLQAELDALATDVSDTILSLGERPRTLAIAAYAIGVANAPHDRKVAAALAPAERFYAVFGKRSKAKTPKP